MMDFQSATKEGLLGLPTRPWNQTSTYDSIAVFNSGEVHDSGWATMAVIGVNDGKAVEIASLSSDDIEWVVVGPTQIGSFSYSDLHSDMSPASGAIHMWSRRHRFLVDVSLSSLRIEMVLRAEVQQ